MLREKCVKVVVALAILGLWISLPTNQAQAVPSFARQTGLECNSCHTMFPELTSVGRNFKLNGFTATKHGDKSYEWPPPVSAMVQLSFTHLNKDRPPNSGFAGGFGLNFDPSNRANDNVNVPQAISLFYGSRIYGEHVGGLIQGTYDGVGNKFFLDNTDVRVTVKPELFGKPLILGLTVNNNPTVSD
ncbi:MAG: cytochrome C, partial [Desulfobaccales bacterium]